MGQWASYQIRKIEGCACAGNAGNVFPRRRFQREPVVSDPGMHHGTCVTHVPWCKSGSLTCGDGENVPGIPGACAPGILRIWQEANGARKDRHVRGLALANWARTKWPTFCKRFFVYWSKFEQNIFPGVQLTRSQLYFSWWIGPEQTIVHNMRQWWPHSLAYILDSS